MTEDFPPAELKPWLAIEKRLLAQKYVCLGLFEGEALRGYAYFARMNDKTGQAHYLFDYFAVLKPYRNLGWGSFFLRQMQENLPNAGRILIEVENPDCASDDAKRLIQEKRLRFYIKNGVTDTGVTAQVYGVEYRILAYSSGLSPRPEEVRSLYSAFYHSFFPPFLYKRKVLIR